MTDPIDRSAAHDAAVDAAEAWGISAPLGLAGTVLPNGWRFHPILPTNEAQNQIGSSHVAVCSDGSVVRVPAGASDAVIERLFAEP